jgi:hypothetical protein
MVLLCKKLRGVVRGDGGSYSSRRPIFPAGPAVTAPPFRRIRHHAAKDSFVVTSHINHAARGARLQEHVEHESDPRLSVFKRWRVDIDYHAGNGTARYFTRIRPC